jgi:hypothetical protein
MAVTVYFLDKDWNYREMLLGFEPLHGPHTGNNLSDVLYQLLKERGLNLTWACTVQAMIVVWPDFAGCGRGACDLPSQLA